MKIKFIIYIIRLFLTGKEISLEIITDYFKHKKKLLPTDKLILIACFTKSGSTYLSHTLQQLTGFKRGHFVYEYTQREQELDIAKIIDSCGKKLIIQQHCKGNNVNYKLIKEFGIRPIILVRNIFDIVVSMREHLLNEDIKVIQAYLNDSFFSLEKQEQYDLVIEMMIPWYISFYVSWMDAIKKNEVDILLISYEQLTQTHKHETISKIIAFYNLKISNQEIATLLSEQNNQSNGRFNKGIAGRGMQELDIEQQSKIKAYTRFYPKTDFSIIGI